MNGMEGVGERERREIDGDVVVRIMERTERIGCVAQYRMESNEEAGNSKGQNYITWGRKR